MYLDGVACYALVRRWAVLQSREEDYCRRAGDWRGKRPLQEAIESTLEVLSWYTIFSELHQELIWQYPYSIPVDHYSSRYAYHQARDWDPLPVLLLGCQYHGGTIWADCITSPWLSPLRSIRRGVLARGEGHLHCVCSFAENSRLGKGWSSVIEIRGGFFGRWRYTHLPIYT